MHACPNCGAPLPIAAPGEIERCPFCSAETREPLDPRPRPSDDLVPKPAADLPREPASRSASPVAADPVLKLYRIIGIAIAVACGVGGLVIGLRACAEPRSSISPPVTPTTAPTPAPVTTLTLANLATTPFAGSETLDAPGMVGAYGSFDPVANCDWARKIGTTWKPDAVMYSVEVQRVGKDGTVDLTTTGAEVLYAFGSVKCAADYRSASASDHQRCALFVELKASQWPQVKVRQEGFQPSLLDRAHVLSTPGCSIRQAVAALRSALKLPGRSFYDASLSNTTHEAWTVSMLAGEGSGGGRVNAATCAVE